MRCSRISATATGAIDDEVGVARQRALDLEPGVRKLPAQRRVLAHQAREGADRGHRDAAVTVLARAARHVLELLDRLDHARARAGHSARARAPYQYDRAASDARDHVGGREETEQEAEVGQQRESRQSVTSPRPITRPARGTRATSSPARSGRPESQRQSRVVTM